MSQTRKKPCKFFSMPGGCRNGHRCSYDHGKPGSEQGSERSPSETRATDKKPLRAPRGKCDFYWSTGFCRRAFQCKFEHELSPSVAQERKGASGSGGDVAAENTFAPLLALSALSDMAISGGDAFRDSSSTLTPQQTQGYLAKFLKDNFRFSTPAHMCSFATLLASASSLNKYWTNDDGQLFLVAVSSDNGCLLLSSILSYEKVSSTLHYDPKVLSFQRGYLPVFQYLSSKFVVKSTLGHHVKVHQQCAEHLSSSLYAVLHNHLDRILCSLEECIGVYMTARSFKEKPTSPESSGAVVFGPIVTVLYEYLTRFKTALAMHKNLGSFVSKLDQWVEDWANDISLAVPTFGDVLTTVERQHARDLVSNQIKDRMQRVISIVEREQAGIDRSASRKAAREANSASQADAINLVRTLENYYEGPGEERDDGPRHENDHLDITAIKVAPTDEELTCRLVPFLPANLPNAPHPFPKNSMQRLLDIQFRLLREELLAPLRKSVQVLHDDMTAPASRKTQLQELKKRRGGRYNYQDRQDSVMFNVYTNINFSRIEVDSRRGLVVELQLDAPPGSARSSKSSVRSWYWANGKRLMMGGLVAILRKRNENVDVYLGILCSPSEKLAEAAKASADKLPIRVQFFDAIVNFKVLEHMRSSNKEREERLMVESSVMFETVRPFLESLKRMPETIPFAKYLPHPLSGSLTGTQISPPAYSAIPGFVFNLESLSRSGEEDGLRGLRLITTNPASVEDSRATLRRRSRLDESQAEAIVDALTREVALIQGPPGTGKTFIGIELIRILIQNDVGPILLIAFTNHALDHMLASIINNGITPNVVRLGGRSTDETIKRYSIEELERASGRSYLDQAMKSEYKSIKATEEETMKLLKQVIGVRVASRVLFGHISILFPDHVAHLEAPPSWIRELHSLQVASDGDAWQEVPGKGKGKAEAVDTSLYGFWKAGGDLQFLHDARVQREMQNNPSLAANRFGELLRVAEQSSDKDASEGGDSSSLSGVDTNQDSDSDSQESASNSERHASVPTLTDAEMFFLAYGELEIPQEPVSDRPLEVLLEGGVYDVWSYSACERTRVDSYWVTQCREAAYNSQKQRVEGLVERHSELRERQRCRDEEIRLNIVRKRKLVGCTTTGAAKLISLLKGLSPRVMIVEEAGQVLESHVLASLVDSVEHLVLIGDPLQLRPTLNNFSLSMDNPRGKELYRFDMSLMERLSSTGFPMTRLDVQRRMRPGISSLIRDTLYPGLVDHECVLQYQSVRGMEKDVFFLTHGNKEHGGGDDSVSKHNPYEVEMIKDLVKYLFRQGCYSDEGSIVILCTYLGQLARVRDSLKGEMAVIIDERDQEALAQHEGDEEEDNTASIERVHITQRVKVRSVDNYQGEEADIVILSLVRNSGGGHESNEHDIITRRTVANIGFLRSDNRTNVALSRARQGLYILGNASDLSSRSPMWSSVINQLEKRDAIGEAIPIKCQRHPDEIRYISKPGDLPKVSPDGGCLRNCGVRLSCGHNCPYKCHPDDENHRNIFCTQPCPKLCPKGHPCLRQCAESCGNCKHPIRDVKLPCGHVHKSVPCYQMGDLSQVKCMVMVERDLPTSPTPRATSVKRFVTASSLAVGNLAEQGVTFAKTRRPQINKISGKVVLVTTRTDVPGHSTVDMNVAAPALLIINVRTNARKGADNPVFMRNVDCLARSPVHHVKSLAHGPAPIALVQCRAVRYEAVNNNVCARLPCDLRCEKTLSCGHRCPSVCGEDCSIQLCLECGPRESLNAIADFILQRSLSELHPSQETLDELIITLPDCRHAFTVETLDGHCQMQEYYERDDRGRWRSLKSPQPGFKAPPVCPTCRRAVRSPRYGRVYKRADLDIVERNTAAQLNRSIRSAAIAFDTLDKTKLRQAFKDGFATFRFVAADDAESRTESREKPRLRLLDSEDKSPVAWNALDPGKDLHRVQPEVAKRWSKETKQIKPIYQRAFKIASARSAHLIAWESAFSSLYRQELENAAQDPATAPRYPAEYAMRIARLKVGLSKPLADKRFCVEAFWLMIEIRFLLASMAQEWLKPGMISPANFSSFKAIWTSFIVFLLKTCDRDAAIALSIAEASQSRRQALRSRVLVLQAKLETLKFSFQTFQSAVPIAFTREELADNVCAVRASLDLAVDDVNALYGRSRGTGMVKEDLTNLFLTPMSTIREELVDLEDAVRKGAIYIPVSFEEKRQIMAALIKNKKNPDLTYSGHFYQCPNGHPYVIGDCGGAAVTARCPECYELIGGSNHSLLMTNRRDHELEEIARAQGVQPSPWPWIDE